MLGITPLSGSWSAIGSLEAKREVSPTVSPVAASATAARRSFLSAVVLGDEQVDVFLLDADEVVDMGVPYENLQVSLVLEIKFEVVSEPCSPNSTRTPP